MAKYTFLFHPGCGTCKKARAWLDAHGVDYTPRDIRTENPGVDELRAIAAASGRAAKRLFNTSGQKYRALGLKDRLPALADAEVFELLASDGMLVKRPILLGEGLALVGFREAEWRAALGLEA